MKVLFVSSGNSGSISVIADKQASALRKQGVLVENFLIKGKGIFGYIKNIPRLRCILQTGNYDIVHAHYSFSGFITTLAGCKRLVVSLMGSDAYMNVCLRFFERFFYSFFWNTTIVKTSKMQVLLKMPKANIIPNGVDIDHFKPMSRVEARKYINYTANKKLILFGADPSRPEKNFILAQEAVQRLVREDVELMPLFDQPGELVPYYLNAADLLLLTSEYEGSVNIIKEAMACNLQVVSTDVGDVAENLTSVNGSYVCKHNPIDISDGILKALMYKGHLNGRDKLVSMGLDSMTISQRLLAIYEKVINGK